MQNKRTTFAGVFLALAGTVALNPDLFGHQAAVYAQMATLLSGAFLGIAAKDAQ